MFLLKFVSAPRPHPSAVTYAHPCYSNCAHVFKNCNNTKCITNNIAPMPTQNPWAWAWVWAPNVRLCHIHIHKGII